MIYYIHANTNIVYLDVEEVDGLDKQALGNWSIDVLVRYTAQSYLYWQCEPWPVTIQEEVILYCQGALSFEMSPIVTYRYSYSLGWTIQFYVPL